jgi:hypothetical protein
MSILKIEPIAIDTTANYTANVFTANSFVYASNGQSILANISSLPPQTGNNGKYLKTDGSNANWSSLLTNVPILTNAGTTSNINIYNGTISILTNIGTYAAVPAQ